MELSKEMPKERDKEVPSEYFIYNNGGREDLFELRFELFDWLKVKGLTYWQARELLRCLQDAMRTAWLDCADKIKLTD